MIQTDKERLAVSTAIAIFLYAGLFAATAWLDILNPAEAKDYGELTVMVSLQEPESWEIPPPKIETTPPEVVPEPVIEPEPVAEREPEPLPQPEPAPPVNTEPIPESRVQSASSSERPAQASARSSPGRTSPAAAEQTPASNVSASVETAPTSTTVPAERASVSNAQAAAAEIPQYFGESESVSLPSAEVGTEYFKSVGEDAPTDQFGETRYVFGSETPTRTPDQTRIANETAAPDQRPFIDLTPLNSVQFSDNDTAGDGGPGTGDSDGTAAQGGNTIEAGSFSELMSQRMVERRYDPDIRDIGLPGGLRKRNVQVEFVIRQDGVVIAVKVEDTGDATLNARIGEALRRWKFQPIQQDIQQVARLLYQIEASD